MAVMDTYKKISEKYSVDLSFANEYFAVLSTSKKIKKTDVEFFFEYYQEERKNKAAVLEMLTKGFRVIGLGKDVQYQEKSADNEKIKIIDNSTSLVSLFQKETIFKLKKCNDLFDELRETSDLNLTYPELNANLYDFLDLDNINESSAFANNISEKLKEINQLIQEETLEYSLLSELSVLLNALCNSRDVVDNFDEFKIIVKYPKLTPYMFSFSEIKKRTLKLFYEIAQREYSFVDETDFILKYLLPLYNNFGVSIDGIKFKIRKTTKLVQNKATKENVFSIKTEQKRTVPVWAIMLHFFAYFPVYVVYLVFEIFKAIFNEMRKMVVPIFIIVFLITNVLLYYTGIGGMLTLIKLFNKNEWLYLLSSVLDVNLNSSFGVFVGSVMFIILQLAISVLPALIISKFIQSFALLVMQKSDFFERGFDWFGEERVFQNIFKTMKIKTRDRVTADKQLFLREYLIRGCLNIFATLLVIVVIQLLPIGFEKFSETTGYFQNDDEAAVILMDERYARVVSNASNIISSPTSVTDIIGTARNGEVVLLTGNKEVGWADQVYCEIYLDDNNSKTGWVPADYIKIIGMQTE